MGHGATPPCMAARAVPARPRPRREEGHDEHRHRSGSVGTSASTTTRPSSPRPGGGPRRAPLRRRPRAAGRPWPAPNRVWFMLESVRVLREELAQRDAPLVVRTAGRRRSLPELAARARRERPCTSAATSPRTAGTATAGRGPARPGAGRRPRAPGQRTSTSPKRSRTLDGRAYTVYSPFRRAWDRLPLRAVLPAPIEFPGGRARPRPRSRPSPTWVSGRRPRTRPLPRAGRAGGAASPGALAHGRPVRVDGYAARRDLLGVDGSSRLSTDLRFGLLSSNEVAAEPGDRARVPGPTLPSSPGGSSTPTSCATGRRSSGAASRPAYDAVAWRDDPAGVAAWREGRTGYPVVDAAMRQLRRRRAGCRTAPG